MLTPAPFAPASASVSGIAIFLTTMDSVSRLIISSSSTSKPQWFSSALSVSKV